LAREKEILPRSRFKPTPKSTSVDIFLGQTKDIYLKKKITMFRAQVLWESQEFFVHSLTSTQFRPIYCTQRLADQTKPKLTQLLY
jgi:hypothetical protein